METATEKPSLKDRILAHKEEIIHFGVYLGTVSACIVISNKIKNAQLDSGVRATLETIKTEGKFVTEEIDGVQYVIHKYTEK